MCRFISIAVKNKDAAKSIFAGYSLWENDNHSFKKEISENYEALWVTDSHCSCDFYSEPYDPDLEAVKLKKKYSKPKYKKKGWSKERIKREVAQILNRPRHQGGLSEPLFQCFQAYAKKFGDCYFHIGWYAGDQTKQGIKVNERISLEIGSGKVQAKEIHENIIYTFI